MGRAASRIALSWLPHLISTDHLPTLVRANFGRHGKRHPSDPTCYGRVTDLSASDRYTQCGERFGRCPGVADLEPREARL